MTDTSKPTFEEKLVGRGLGRAHASWRGTPSTAGARRARSAITPPPPQRLIDARLHVSAPGDEVWVAIATQAVDGRFVEERLRDVLFRVVFDAARAEVAEPRADWPSGSLAWFEVARLGLREPPT
jgi:hypothetical protein